MKTGAVHMGTSGWSYKHWKGIFYPEKLAATRYLNFYAQYYDVTEVNTSFYHIPRKTTVENWLRQVPDGFLFCPKLSRYITHLKKLHDAEPLLEKFFEVFDSSRKSLGPVLIQLPANLHFHAEVAGPFFEILHKKYKQYHFAIEIRHKSWLEEESIALMKQHKITLVFAHSDRFPYDEIITAKHIYLRFHGPGRLYGSSYPDKMLREYAKKIVQWQKDGHTIWVFFNNDMNGYALDNVTTLKNMVEQYQAKK